MPSLAEQYEAKHPNTGCSEAQKQERMEREIFKAERLSLRRTGRNRGIVVPSLPWQEEAA
jgi:hypothetical protein